MRLGLYGVMGLMLCRMLWAQEDIPLLLPEEKRAVDAQAEDFNRAILPTLEKAAKSTVRVWVGSRRLAYGTVVGDGTRILSKWSELARTPGALRVDDGSEGREVRVSGVYPEEDLALLEVVGDPLVPVEWLMESPGIGSFLAAPQPDGRMAAFGVVSVLERNLRDTDMAFLGVGGVIGHTGRGVKISEVKEGSGAAAAGLEVGDVILKVGERSISGLLELQNALTGQLPGQTLTLTIEKEGKETKVEVILGNRPKSQQMFGGRLQQMERMGGPISEVRSSFTRAIQTDMRPRPNQIGGPVVDLQGRVVGITLARADRTRSFVMPAAAVVDLLGKKPQDPEVVRAALEAANVPRLAENRTRPPQNRQSRPRGVPMPGGEERMRRHLSDMERLMEHLRAELDGLEQSR
jgi:serine protease Do